MKCLNLSGVFVNAGDIMTEFGKAGSRYQPHIAGSDHGDMHITVRLKSIYLGYLRVLLQFVIDDK